MTTPNAVAWNAGHGWTSWHLTTGPNGTGRTLCGKDPGGRVSTDNKLHLDTCPACVAALEASLRAVV